MTTDTTHKPSPHDQLEDLAKKLTPAQRQRVTGYCEAMLLGHDSVPQLSKRLGSLEGRLAGLLDQLNGLLADVERLAAEQAAP